MTEAEVTQLLGPALVSRRYEGPETYLHFSRSPEDTHYRHRLVVVKGGSVVEVLAEFYID